MTPTDSFLLNCHIIPRKSDGPLFVQAGALIVARLDGYTIVPTELYESFGDVRRYGATPTEADESPSAAKSPLPRNDSK